MKSDSSILVKSEDGLYYVRGGIEPEHIIQTAAGILLDKISNGEKLTNAKSAADFLQMSLANHDNEHFAALFLDKQHRVIGFETLFTGTIDSTAVYPRVVVEKALDKKAAAVIFAHNHPSNDPEPSTADKMITKRLCEALELIDVTVLDHFVITRNSYTSLSELGCL